MNDIYNNTINKRASDQRVLTVGRWATVGLAVITVATALARPNTLLNLLIWLGVVNAAYLTPIVMGAYFKRVNRTGAFVSIIVAIFVGFLVYGGGELDLLFGKIPMFSFPKWFSGSILSVIVSFMISTIGTLGSSFASRDSYEFSRMENWKPFSIRDGEGEGVNGS